MKIQNKIYLAFLLSLNLLFTSSVNVQAEAEKEKERDIYYLSASGYLLKLNLDTVAESGQITAGSMPWGLASYGGHIYISDFGADQIFDFAPSEKYLNKVKVADQIGLREIEIFLSKDKLKAKKKPSIQTAFEKIHKPKIKPAKDENQEPLDIAKHNKRLGLSNMACNDKYLFVISTLKNKVEIFSRDKLERISSLTVGERPSHISISPNGLTIAVTSIGLNKVHLISANGNNFELKSEISVEEGPTEMIWLNDNRLFVLNRGADSISVLDNVGKESKVLETIKLNAPINTMALADDKKFIYALNGTDHKLFLINTSNFKFEQKDINENLKYANLLLPLTNDELLIGSEPDGKLMIFSLKTFETIKKIQTNLLPKAIISL